MTKLFHPFHLVSVSPWPILMSLNMLNNLILASYWMNKPMNIKPMIFMLLSISSSILCSYMWWQDITHESTFQGSHSKIVYKGLRMGMILFITSEIFFFISFFWAYFHSSLSPTIEIGQTWPPIGVIPFNPYDIPLLNTIILISSGLTVTWSHHCMINSNLKESMLSLFITVLLGMYFSMTQLFEYIESPFSMSDSIYGSTFFIATGFHGLHVIIGTSFLLICLIRMFCLQFSPSHHMGFEAAAWYWHFVDVVWLFLYISIYWWSY